MQHFTSVSGMNSEEEWKNKMGKIYDETGWLNWDYLYPECKFIMAITGPRAVGKTYGILKYIAQHNIPFIYMRRLKAQLDQCASGDENNPFRAYCMDTGDNIRLQKTQGSVQFYRPRPVDPEDPDAGEEKVIIGQGVALSTVATIRGSDFSGTEAIIFDEYIPMKNERPIKDEANAFYNFLETVNRNRELLGRPPVKVFMLGNANKLMNPYYLKWGFMKTALKMIHGNQMVWRNSDSSRIMIMLLHSPISERKRETALYKEAAGGFTEMALDNAFETDATTIAARKLKDCRHIVSIGSIGIYQLKSTGKHYVSETVNRTNFYEENEINIVLFRSRFAGLKNIYIYGFMEFENYDCELLFREYIGL